MWSFIPKCGFLSVVQHDGRADQVVVRARVADDLVRLKALFVPKLGAIEATPQRDYGWRADCSKAAFARALAKAAADIDYFNVKAETARRLGRAREAVCHEVWATLLQLRSP